MKIETKYDIGQEVWAYWIGQPQKCIIVSITSRVYKIGKVLDYTVENPNGTQFDRLESDLYPTKEELLKSL